MIQLTINGEKTKVYTEQQAIEIAKLCRTNGKEVTPVYKRRRLSNNKPIYSTLNYKKI